MSVLLTWIIALGIAIVLVLIVMFLTILFYKPLEAAYDKIFDFMEWLAERMKSLASKIRGEN